MKFMSLFAGIGGFDLGLERAGMQCVAQCEIDEYCIGKLNKHWPDVPVYKDIRKLDGKQFKGSVELICGGFPCQPFSVAGKQAGKDDDRHLWPEMFRLIREIKPKYVIGENVAGFISMALDDVLSDLEGEGYRCEVFVLPACSVGGIHRRDRVWIVAHSKSSGSCRTSNETSGKTRRSDRTEAKQSTIDGKVRTVSNTELTTSGRGENSPECHGQERESTETKPNSLQLENREENADNSKSSSTTLADSNINRLQGRARQGKSEKEKGGEFQRSKTARASGQAGYRPIKPPTESPVRHRDDGLSENVARLKALGNAVVPQIPELIGRAIMEIENEHK